MGLGQHLTALALRRVHVLLVEVPGWWSTRVAAEQELTARGWVQARSPADADALLVCGHPGGRLDAAVQLVWDQLPGPRARERTDAPADVAAALDRAAAVLADVEEQRRDVRDRGQGDEPDEEPGHDDPGPDEDSDEMSDMHHGDMHHGDMHHGDMDHGMDHGAMDHGGMDMAPGGIPLAGGGEDRDGLEMDVLQVPLGPVLPCWPAGLVLRCSLQGDVVVAAEVDVLPAGSPAPVDDLSPEDDRSAGATAARLCDHARQVLELAGWGAAARQAAWVRDDLLTDGDAVTCLTRLERLRGMVERSWVLRWSLRDLGRAPTVHGSAAAPVAAGDVHDRLVSMLRAAGDLLAGHVEERSGDRMRISSRWAGIDPDALPGLVTGLDVAAVRLVVASLAPDTAPSDTPAAAEVSGG